MHLPSLNLGAVAGRMDSAISRSVASSLGRAAGRAAWGSAKGGMSFGARAGLAGMGLALSVGGAAAVGAVGVAYGAGRVFNAALNTPTFRPGVNGGLPFTDRGGRMVSWQKHGRVPFTNKHFWTPTLSNRMTDMVGGGAVAAGIGGGIIDANRARNPSIAEYSPLAGAPEITNDQLLGATGSLALSLYYNRGRRPRQLDMHRYAVEQANRQDAPLSSAVMGMDRTEAIHALHLAHMAVAG